MVTEGWDLAFVTCGVESNGGKGDSKGIFIICFIFKRLKENFIEKVSCVSLFFLNLWD